VRLTHNRKIWYFTRPDLSIYYPPSSVLVTLSQHCRACRNVARCQQCPSSSYLERSRQVDGGRLPFAQSPGPGERCATRGWRISVTSYGVRTSGRKQMAASVASIAAAIFSVLISLCAMARVSCGFVRTTHHVNGSIRRTINAAVPVALITASSFDRNVRSSATGTVRVSPPRATIESGSGATWRRTLGCGSRLT
jgi:hypothetical protein